MTGVAKNTIAKLLADLGAACARFQNRTRVNLTTKRVECDGIWSFVGMKEKQVPVERRAEFGVGDVWTWTAIDADPKLCVSWLVGERDSKCATIFMKVVAARLANRVQLTTDGHKLYLVAVEAAFDSEIDYSILVKRYGTPCPIEQRRYSPAICTGIDKEPICGEMPLNADQTERWTSRVPSTCGATQARCGREAASAPAGFRSRPL